LTVASRRLELEPTDSFANAYHGALTVMRARYAFWPGRKLRYLRAGLQSLDDEVSAHPDAVEFRYLRLISCYYLPRFLSRSWSVEEDAHAVASGIQQLRWTFERSFYYDLVKFVLAYENLDDAEKSVLAAELRWARDETSGHAK
jgi:hypothetical protein